MQEQQKKPTSKPEAPENKPNDPVAGATVWMNRVMEFNAAQLNALAESSQRYLEGVTKLNGELVDFLSGQAAKGGDLSQRMAKCENWSDATKFYQEWTGSAVETCMAESKKLTEITADVAQKSWSPMIEKTNEALRGMAQPDA